MSDILTGFNMQGNDPIDDRIVSKSNLETLEQYLNRVPVQKRYYGLTFFALDKNNELRKYTFQTSLINPTIDDDEEEIERIDKELQEHVSDKAIHKTSEEIRSEIVDADIPDTISRVQWTLDQINTAVINLIGGASDEYNTLKRIQTKIEELRAKIYGDDGGTVLKTLEQALKFLNQYKDFIVDIPENFVSKQDIVDNLTTDDPTKVLSAKQGKVLSDTLTNYFESAMQSIRTETDRAINAENRIETKLDKEIDRSIKEDQRIDAKLDAEIKRSTDEDLRIDSKLDAEIERSTNEDIRIDNKLDSEINRSTAEDDRLDKKIDAETTRATDAESNLNTKIETETDRAEGEESRIETKLDNEITRSTNKDTEHDNRLQVLEGQTHEQNTDLGTTNSTFQLKYNTGNKIKHESDAISVRNAADTDYVNFIAKNATFKGDLLVEGQSFVTEAETVEIKDNLLLLNKGEVGAGVTKGIAGLEIDRGTEPNYFIIFDESDNRFKAGVEGDLWNLALRESDDNMLDGYFISWNSKDKILSTTNIVKESTPLLFGRTDYKRYSGYKIYQGGSYSSYSFIDETPSGFLYNSAGDNDWNIDTSKLNFRFWKPLLGTTFKRVSDNSEVLYHADIVNNLTSGGTNKVLSAEQGKLLQNSITSIQGSYLPLSGGIMTGPIAVPYGWDIRTNDGNGILKINSDRSVEVGHLSGVTKIRSYLNDILHIRNDTSYKIYDEFNLPDPARLGSNQTFTGLNTFTKKITVGSLTPSQILLDPANGIYSQGNIRTSGWLTFEDNEWTDTGWAYKEAKGSIKVLSVINEANNKPTSYGSVLQFNSRQGHWCTQIWCDQTNAAGVIGTLRFRTTKTYASTEWNPWTALVTTSDLNSYLTKTEASTLYYPYNGRGYLSITSTGKPVMSNNQGYSVKDKDGNEREVLWMGTDNTLNLGNTSQYTLNILNLRCTTLTHNGNKIATQNYVTNQLSNYLPLTGGTLSGNLTINTVGSTTFVINNNDTNGSETFMRVLRKGTASAAIGFRDSLGAYIYNYNSNKYLFIDNNGDARVGTTNGSTKLALITDIPTVSGYLPLSGGTLTGTLSINSGGSEPLIINNSASAGEAYVVTKTQGTTRGVMGWNSSLGMFLQDSRGYTFSVKADGVYFGASSSTLTKLPTSTDLSGYLPLAGGTMSGNISFNEGTGYIVVGARETSNYVRAVSFNKGSATNSAYIGYHSTGGSDSSGALILVPYPTSANPWAKTVGLYIAKNELLLDGKAIATQEYVNNRSVSWSNITGKPSTYTPSAHSHNSLQIEDNRDVTMLPNNMGQTTLRTFFNANNMPTSDWYSGIHISGWVTNYAAWELCGPSSNNTTTASSLYFRSGKDSTWNSWKKIAFTSDIPTIPSISISNSGSGNAVTSITANGHTLTVTKGATYLTSHQTIYDLTFQAGTFSAKTFDPNGAAATVNIPTKTSHLTNDSGFITSSALSGYATQSWANGQFAPLSRFNTSTGYTTIKVSRQELNFDSADPEIYMNFRTLSGSTAVKKITWKGGSNSTLCEGRWGNLYMNDNLVATQTWSNSQYPLKTGTGASGTWDINISGNASTASAASKLGSTTIGGSAKPIYLSSGTPTACSATVGSATVPVYMNAGTITQCSTTLGVSITGNAATATNSTQLGGTAASSYVKANDNISRLTNDSGYTTQEWVNGQGFLTSDSILDKFVPTTGGYIRNSDQVLLRLQRTGVSTGTSRTIEMYFDDSNTDGTSTTPRGSIGYNSEVGMFLYSAKSKKYLAMEYTGRPFYGTPENRYYLLGSNTEYHNLDGYQRIGNIMIQWGYFSVQGNSTRAVNFPVSFTNTVWSVTGSWDNTTTGSQENWGFTDYTSSGFTIINGDGSSRVFHYIAVGPFTRS